MVHGLLVLAQAAGGSPMDLKSMLPFILAFVGIWYVLVLRPQQKQVNDHKGMVASLRKGDEVVTQSGILGKVHAVEDKVVTVEVASGVRLRMLKSAIQSRGAAAQDAATAVPAKTESKEEK